MKNKKNLCTVRTSYDYYKQNNDNPVSPIEYRKILYLFFKFILKELFLAREISLPCKLGSLQILGRKKKPKVEDGKIVGLSPDWKETKKLWGTCQECKDNKQLVYHFNEHTNGVRYKFVWAKKTITTPNKSFYYFKPARAVKRQLAQAIKEGKEFIVL